MPQIRDVLVDSNPWWKGAFAAEYKEREIYDDVRKYLKLRHIVALTGLRRVGKTTLVKKIAEDAIAGGLDPKHVLYFSFDEFKDAEIRDVLREYEALLEQDVTKGRYLLLFDEVQKLDDWENQLKALYDRSTNVKIVISGSESLFIRRRSRETLGGRIFEFRIEPLTFREYLTFKGIAYRPMGLYEKEVARELNAYTRTLGFPELVDVTDRAIVRKYVRESIVEKIVYRDLPRLVKIKDVTVLEALLNIIVEEPGQIIELDSLASDLKISRRTVSTYLTYLEQSFLVRKLYNFSTGRRKVERKLKKYYPTVASVDLLFRDDDLSRSRAFEWLVVTQLRAEFFWRDARKNEVDVVLPDGPTAVEIKYGRIDTSGVAAFAKAHKTAKLVIVSSQDEGTRKADGTSVTIVPAYKFLLRET